MRKALSTLLCAAICITAVSALAQTTPAADVKSAAPKGTAAVKPPTAESVYDAMIEAWHKADSLSYESDYQASDLNDTIRCRYKVWLKKPNFARLEAYQGNKLKGVLVCDGENICAYWQGGPPAGYVFDKRLPDDFKTTTSYATHPAPAGRHSIAADVSFFGIGLAPLADPSMSSGAGDPMQRYIDSGRIEGIETVAGEKCDVLRLACGKLQSETTLWLSQRDHLPRKGKRISRAGGQVTVTETWSKVELGGAVPDDKFAWKPQEDWRSVRKATLEDGLLQPGTPAPEFTLVGADGGKISLSDYKGKVVWLHIWMAG